jgi:hypothetical protein
LQCIPEREPITSGAFAAGDIRFESSTSVCLVGEKRFGKLGAFYVKNEQILSISGKKIFLKTK